MSKTENEQKSKKDNTRALILVGVGAVVVGIAAGLLTGRKLSDRKTANLQETITKLLGKLELLDKENKTQGRIINDLVYQLGKKVGLENIKRLRK